MAATVALVISTEMRLVPKSGSVSGEAHQSACRRALLQLRQFFVPQGPGRSAPMVQLSRGIQTTTVHFPLAQLVAWLPSLLTTSVVDQGVTAVAMESG